MARIAVNPICNVCTGADVRNPRASVEITVPGHRLRFLIGEARELADALREAVKAAEGIQAKETK